MCICVSPPKHAQTQGALDGVTSAGGWKTRLTVGSFQVDNHMARAHFPVVLRPAEEEEDAVASEQAANKCVGGQWVVEDHVGLETQRPDHNVVTRVSRPPSIRLDMEIAPPRPSLLLHVRLLRLAMRRLVLNLDQSTALAVQRLQQRMAIFAASSSGAAQYAYLSHPAGEQQQAASVGPASVSRLHAFPLASVGAMAAAGKDHEQQAQAQQQSQQQQQQQQGQRRKLFIERLRLDALAINLSLSRPRESPDEVNMRVMPAGWLV